MIEPLPASRDYADVPLHLIDEPENPTRTEMDDEKLEELTRDVRKNGVVQALGVYREGERFRIRWGHRRYHAAKRAGLVAVPCRVFGSKGQATIALQYAENRHREDVNPADEARWFAEQLEAECGGDVEQLCELLNEKESYVQSRLVLLVGDERVFDALRAGQLALGHATVLNGIRQPEYRAFFLDLVQRTGMKVAELRRQVDDFERSALANRMNAGVVTAGEAAAIAPAPSLMHCVVCGESDRPETMAWLHVHGHCNLAVLEKVLRAYRGVSG